MTNTTWSMAASHASDALFRTWGLAVKTALTAVGMVNTSDTGQIDWSTVVRTGAATDTGYEIWRFNDALQSTSPIFFKVWYGCGATTSTPRIRIEVGTASNGSGTLSGIGSGTLYQVSYGASADATARDNWMASDGSGLVASFWTNSSVTGCRGLFVIERFRDSSGTALGTGWYMQYLDYSSKGVVVQNAADSISTTLTYTPCMVPFTPSATGQSLLTSSNQIVAYPHYVSCKRGTFGSKMILSYSYYDLGYDNQQAISHLGATRTYRSIGSFQPYVEYSQALFGPFIWWSD